MHYKTLINNMAQYTDTDQATIKANIKRLMKHNSTKHKDISKLCNITKHTGHSYTNFSNPNKPSLYNLCILAAYWNEDITELFKDH